MMRKQKVEWIILFLQLAAFYLLPLAAGPTDTMGLVVLLLLITIILSFAMGCFSKRKIIWLYPLIAAATFVPTVFIYYNETATIHALWYFVCAAIGMLAGYGMRILTKR